MYHFHDTMDVMIEIIVRRTLLTLIVVVICGVVFHAPLSVWLGTMFPDNQLLIKSWKELLIVAALLLTAVQVSYRRQWQTLRADWLIRLVAVYGAIHIALLPFMWQGALPAAAGLMIDLRFVAFFVVVYVALRLYPQWRRPLLIGSVAAAGVSLLFTVLQVTVLPNDVLKHIGYDKETTIAPYLTVDQNYDFVRVNGTLRGPNPLGIYAVIVLAGCLAALLMVRTRLHRLHRLAPWAVAALGVASLVAVWYSYSRSAKLALLVAVGVVVMTVYGKYINKPLWLALATTGLLLVGGVYVMRDTPFVSTVVLHADPDEGNDVNSNDGHWESLVDGTQRMLRQPLGAGIGSTGSPSLIGDTQPLIIENHLLYIAHEVGWVGLAIFLALCVAVLRGLWRRRDDWLALALLASGLGAALASLFLPVWADDTVSVVWWGLAGMALGTTYAVKKGKKRGQSVK